MERVAVDSNLPYPTGVASWHPAFRPHHDQASATSTESPHGDHDSSAHPTGYRAVAQGSEYAVTDQFPSQEVEELEDSARNGASDLEWPSELNEWAATEDADNADTASSPQDQAADSGDHVTQQIARDAAVDHVPDAHKPESIIQVAPPDVTAEAPVDIDDSTEADAWGFEAEESLTDVLPNNSVKEIHSTIPEESRKVFVEETDTAATLTLDTEPVNKALTSAPEALDTEPVKEVHISATAALHTEPVAEAPIAVPQELSAEHAEETHTAASQEPTFSAQSAIPESVWEAAEPEADDAWDDADPEADSAWLPPDESSVLINTDDPVPKQFEAIDALRADPEPVATTIYRQEETEVPKYEYQGDLTEADIAVDEAPTAALLDDVGMLSADQSAEHAGEPPSQVTDVIERDKTIGQTEEIVDGWGKTDDIADTWGKTDEPNDGWGQVQDGTDDWGQTQDFLEDAQTKSTGASSVEPRSGWDNLEDDTDFSAVIGTVQQTMDKQEAISVVPSQSHPQRSESLQGPPVDASQPAERIEDLWAAALGDDDLLDDSGAVDPSGFFDDDDAGFLEDEPIASSQPPLSTFDVAAPIVSPVRPNPYQPAQNGSHQDLHQSIDPRPASTPATFLPGVIDAFPGNQTQQSRPMLRPSGSFVDKAKAGYASPYDLPTDIVSSRKRPAAPMAAPVQSQPPPPPRSSSMYSAAAAAPPSAPPGQSTQISSTSPIKQNPQAVIPKPPGSAVTSPRAASGFFADLPMSSRPKAQRSGYTPFQSAETVPSMAPPQRAPSSGPMQSPPAAPNQNYSGLQRPAQLPLYPDQPSIPTPSQTVPTPLATTRYSPAPAAQSALGIDRFSPAPPSNPSQNRYAAIPSTPGGTQQRAHSFIPKTSSPLAYHDENEGTHARPALVRPGSASIQSYAPPNVPTDRVSTPPVVPLKTASVQSSPRSSSKYAPMATPAIDAAFSPAPPTSKSPVHLKRSQPSYQPSNDRVPLATYGNQQPFAQVQPQQQQQLALPSKRNISGDLSFDVPRDERAADHLERWKGSPIFRWAPSGAIISSFPKHNPFYAAGHAIPVIKCTAGDIIIHDTKATFPLLNNNDTFPGPLQGKGKGRKKDVIGWMTSKISTLEKALSESQQSPDVSERTRTRLDEKLILWKVVKLLIEHDNALEGKSEVTEAMRTLLVPNDIDETSPLSSHTDNERQGSAPHEVDPDAIVKIRKMLLEGKRERAVWFATENKLWSHAMLIGSTMGPEIWKQLSHEFVKSQVQSVSDSTRSLAAVYEVFAGNWEESIDELVPPFARAGFSVGGQSAASNLSSTSGLEKWRETLAMVLNNRSNNDVQAIGALGRLLAGYGRVEAAHICFIFAGNVVRHSGVNDPEASFVLLGADHKNSATSIGSDLDSILLTEVYEYGQSLAPVPGHAPVIPHLQPYKLIHAYELAEHGHRTQAQAYCDSIFSAIKASTRASPYYHIAFTTAVDDFSRCLSQAPQTAGSSGILSKLSSDKVSGSMWKRFNSFVAGEDDDGASATSGPGETADGPFGKIAGNSPTISRVTSHTDLYMSSLGSINGSSAFSSPVIPSGPYAPSQQTAAAPTGRYAPQPAGAVSNNRSATAPRGYEPLRTSSSYVPGAAASKLQSKPYSPYAAQAQNPRPVNGPYAPGTKPVPVRSASDYQVPYDDGTGQPLSPPASLPIPSALSSPYKQQPSPLSVEHTPPLGADRRASEPFAADFAAESSGYSPPEPQFAHSQRNSSSGSGYELQEEAFGSGKQSYEAQAPSYKPQTTAYQPQAPTYQPQTPSYEPHEQNFEPQADAYNPPAASYDTDGDHAYAPPSTSFDGPEADGSHTAGAGDEPVSSYQPYEPSYVPYEPDYGNNQQDSDEESAPKPKKKSIMDLSDDEDATTRTTTASKAQQKAEADRLADEAFRKAAEADAEKDKAAKEAAAKKGWFGGWFGKKDEDGPKAVRAKLGEENSFYFDKELGKWVNKKGGQDEVKAAPTPPPPKGVPARLAGAPGGPPSSGPPSRIPSGSSSPAMGPPSRPGTTNGMATPPTSAGPPGRTSTPGGLEPPSRPGTGVSNASSIDDLLGAPGAKKGTVKGKKRGGRYVDVMAK